MPGGSWHGEHRPHPRPQGSLKGSRDKRVLGAAPLSDGHSLGGHNRPGVTRALRLWSPPGGLGAAREHIGRCPSGPAALTGAGMRGGVGCAKWPAKPTAKQPKGQPCLFYLAPGDPPPPRQATPSRAPSTLCPELSPTSCAQLPAAGTSPTRCEYFLAPARTKSGAPCCGQVLRPASPVWQGQDPCRARTLTKSGVLHTSRAQGPARSPPALSRPPFLWCSKPNGDHPTAPWVSSDPSEQQSDLKQNETK